MFEMVNELRPLTEFTVTEAPPPLTPPPPPTIGLVTEKTLVVVQPLTLTKIDVP